MQPTRRTIQHFMALLRRNRLPLRTQSPIITPAALRSLASYWVDPEVVNIARRGLDVLLSVTGSCGGSVARMIGSHDRPIGHAVNVSSAAAGEHVENGLRKDSTPMERVAIGKTLEKEIGKRQGQRTDKPGSVSPRSPAPDQASLRGTTCQR